jgi:hypothetical protein
MEKNSSPAKNNNEPSSEEFSINSKSSSPPDNAIDNPKRDVEAQATSAVPDNNLELDLEIQKKLAIERQSRLRAELLKQILKLDKSNLIPKD